MLTQHGRGAFGPIRSACLIFAALLVGSISSAEEPPAASVQLAFVDPLQLVEAERSVRGFRMSLLRGANQDMTGFDLSGIATVTHGMLKGLQIAMVNQVDGPLEGAQIGFVSNNTTGEIRGAQISALVSTSGGGSGLQIGPVMNQTGTMTGLQVGLFNTATSLKGLQLGLLNFNENGFLPFFPIFNYGR